MVMVMVVMMTVADTMICILIIMAVYLSSADFDSQDDQSYDSLI